MAVFNFPHHGNPAFSFEEVSSGIILKGGFKFIEEPANPYVRIFTLEFPVLGYFALPDGNVDLDGTLFPEWNVLALYNFYLEHGTWKSFTYPHPVFGDIAVKFDRPLEAPKVTGNQGKVLNLSVVLREYTA